MKKLTILKILFIFFILIFAIYLSFSKRYDTKGYVEKAFPNLLIDIKKINKISIKDINNEIFIKNCRRIKKRNDLRGTHSGPGDPPGPSKV